MSQKETKTKSKRRAFADLENERQLGEVALEHAKTRQAIEHAGETQQNLARLMEMMNCIPVTLPNGDGSLWEYVLHQMNQTAVSTAKAGLALLVLKEKIGHGNFREELESRDIPKSTAANYMSVAKSLLRLPPSNVQALTHLSGAKLIELARLPEDTLQEIAETEVFDGTPLDEVDRMTTRELKQKVRKQKDKHSRALEVKSKDIERKDKEIVCLQSKLVELEKAKQDLPPDEAEVAAIQQVEVFYWEAVGLFYNLEQGFRLEDASPHVRIKVIQLYEYIEARASYMVGVLMNQARDIYVDAPMENDIAIAREEVGESLEKLTRGLPSLDLN